MKISLSHIPQITYVRSIILMVLCFLSIHHVMGFAQEGPARAVNVDCIDTHNHLFARVGPPRNGRFEYDKAIQSALSKMDQFGIQKMFVMPPPFPANYPVKEEINHFMKHLNKYSDRFGYLGGGGTLNVMIQEAVNRGNVSSRMKEQFKKKALKLISYGILGFGELTTEHFCMSETHNHQSAPPDHPLFLLLADIAAEYQLPIDIHMEAIPKTMPLPSHLISPPNPKTLTPNMEAFERLLSYNRKAKIIWAHVGWDNTGHRTVDLVSSMLSKHPNLYMSFKISPADSLASSNPVEWGNQIKPEWLNLIRSYPDRFVIGSDQFYSAQSMDGDVARQSRRGVFRRGKGPGFEKRGVGPPSVGPTMTFLSLLSIELAGRLAHENAIHLFEMNKLK